MSARSLLGAGLGLVAAALTFASPAAARVLPVELSGAVTVEFRGDPATCAAAGQCGVSGRLGWQPARRGELSFEATRRGTSSSLTLSDSDGPEMLTSQVTRVLPSGMPRVCTDAARAYYSADRQTPAGTTTVPVGLRGGREGPAISALRCAGPRPADLRAALPARRPALAALRRGGETVDLRQTRPFTAGGLTGTVTSTVVLRLGRPEAESLSNTLEVSLGGGGGGDGDRGGRDTVGPRVRGVEARYVVERVTGTLRTDLSGSGDPARCEPLDACMLGGTLVHDVAGRRGRAHFFARADGNGPAARRRLRALVGLGPPGGGGGGRGLDVFGTVFWRTPGGALRADLARGDGGPACRDSLPVEGFGLLLVNRRGRLGATPFPLFTAGDHRTRCPGPRLEEPGTVGSVPLRALRDRRVTLRVRGADTGVEAPYRFATTSDVTITLRRTRLVERSFPADD